MSKYTVAVVGATGAVGREMIKLLEQRKFPVKTLIPLASDKKQGRTVRFKGKAIPVKPTEDKAFNGVDLALFAGGGNASAEFAWEAVRRGALVIDNSSTFRMRADVPLIVPEVNSRHLRRHKGLIANPNCSTIQLCMALKPIYERLGVERVVVSTYQSVSGAGLPGIEELETQIRDFVAKRKVKTAAFPAQILFNAVPHIDVFMKSGYTREEEKMIFETQKIFSDPSMAITATCVRVPVFGAHSESVNVQTRRAFSIPTVAKLFENQPGVKLIEDPAPAAGDDLRISYPLAIDVQGTDDVYVGRLRKDPSLPNGLDMWVVADNLRKGAALNAIQIAEILM